MHYLVYTRKTVGTTPIQLRIFEAEDKTEAKLKSKDYFQDKHKLPPDVGIYTSILGCSDHPGLLEFLRLDIEKEMLDSA